MSAFAPLTWTMDAELVEFIWTETRAVFGNKLWLDSMLDWEGLPEGWQEELAARSGQAVVDVLIDAIGDLRDPDPSLVFLGLHETFSRYGVTLEIAPHPQHGDLLLRARELIDAGAERPPYTRQIWPLDSDGVAHLWREIDAARADTRPEIVARRIADALADCLGDERADELSLRCGDELSTGVYSAIKSVPADADPGLVFAAIREFFAEPRHGDVVIVAGPDSSRQS